MCKLFVLFVVLVCLTAFLSASPARKDAARIRTRTAPTTTTTVATAAIAAVPAVAAVPASFDCGPWVEQPCQPATGAVCGTGSKVWNRTGANCPLQEKTFKCKIPCDEVGLPKSSCKYVKSSWSTCDLATKTKTRTLTLKVKGRRGQTAPAVNNCEPTKTLTKSCADNNNNNNNGNRRGRDRGQTPSA
jgi:hypothetical protein